MSTLQIQSIRALSELIKDRRSIRAFRTDPIDTDLITDLLNVAVWAPTHGLREPWRFILYKGDARKPLAEAMIRTYTAEEKERLAQQKLDYFMQIPAHLIVVMKEDPRQKQWEEDYACVSCLIQNFQLAAWEVGIGVVWKTNPFIHNPSFREAAGVQPGEKIVGLLHIGYPEQVPAGRPRTDAREKLTIKETI
ncbi:nitroreductase family protein [Paenibacillus planticolens]|uniref:Putative NAD(P)H nitroreductase n=1 Tax=Paenibacillus planticolens TaxID=2654976 RepID=A0ABX1ZJX9_9BACL|nr:nitroreductase [Paenibacillus planticolens]NOU99088.1 nitroreductase [Paenibacillus planticolens]